jgi:hypothetical protein
MHAYRKSTFATAEIATSTCMEVCSAHVPEQVSNDCQPSVSKIAMGIEACLQCIANVGKTSTSVQDHKGGNESEALKNTVFLGCFNMQAHALLQERKNDPPLSKKWRKQEYEK